MLTYKVAQALGQMVAQQGAGSGGVETPADFGGGSDELFRQ